MSSNIRIFRTETDVGNYKRTNSCLKCPLVVAQANLNPLQLYLKHTECIKGKNKHIRFIYICFSATCNLLAVLDTSGNIYILDLDVNNYWLVTQINSCTTLSFFPKTYKIIVGRLNGSVEIINYDCTNSKICLPKSHKTSVRSIICNESGNRFISLSNEEAFLWDGESLTKLLTIHHKSVNLKFITFLSRSESIIGCFQDDTFYVWKNKIYEITKTFTSKDWKSSNVTCIAITRNGSAMVIGTKSNNLATIIIATWVLEKIIHLPTSVHGTAQLEFLQQPFDGGSNKYLVCLTICHKIYLIDMNKLICIQLDELIDEIPISRFSLSYSGNFTATLTKSGNIVIYNNNKWMDLTLTNHQTAVIVPKNNKMKSETPKTISQVAIRNILRGFSQFPSDSRHVLWKTILQLPNNKTAYKQIAMKGTHPRFQDMMNEYPFYTKSIIFSVTRLTSNLANWCPLFAQIKYLPIILTPFSELFRFSPLTAFEGIATIFLNYCQYFFEDFPLAPKRIIDEGERILSIEDKELYLHFRNLEFDSHVYIWGLLETMFTQIFNKEDWLIFWDSVLVNDSKYLLMASVAYNIMCRNAFILCETKEELEYIFYHPLNVDVKTLVLKTKILCFEIDSEIEFRHFTPLSKGEVYQMFLEYPKYDIVNFQIIDDEVDKLMPTRKTQDEFDKKYCKQEYFSDELYSD